MRYKGIYTLLFFALIITLFFCFVNPASAYYGGYGLYGGLYGGYGGLMGLYGGYGGLMGLYGGYGGLMGLYGGYYGSLYSPFSFYNLYYPVQTAGGLTYQVPFLQIAPLLGIAGLYNQLFPNLFNPQALTIPSVFGVTFPTPVAVTTPAVT